MTKVLITGANGFVGSALCMKAVELGFDVRGATRMVCDLPICVENIVVGDINADTEWHSALLNCDVVIHLAARVHVMSETADDSLSEFRLVNTTGTERLARCAANSGVKRFVYVSSIKVNGEETSLDLAFCEQDQPNPQKLTVYLSGRPNRRYIESKQKRNGGGDCKTTFSLWSRC